MLLSPMPSAPSAGVGMGMDLLEWAGVPARLRGGRVVEFALNVGLFVPIPLMALHLKPSWRVVQWAMAGLVASSMVEAAQGVFLPHRTADFRDIIANTTGLALGAAVSVGAFRQPDRAGGIGPLR